MKKIFFLIIILLLNIVTITSCGYLSKTNDKDVLNKPQFAVYLIKGENKLNALSFGNIESGTYVDGKKVDLTDFELEEKPLLTEKDIKSYLWRSQKIVLSDEFLKKRNLSEEEKNKLETLDKNSRMQESGSMLLNTKDTDVVVVTINGNRIYSAGFPLPDHSSRCPGEIIIKDSGINYFSILNRRKSDDLRLDKQIYDLFKIKGKIEDK